MKAVFNKISAIFMALVVMFSTMSFSINKHYCMDHLVDVSLILPAENCGMDMGNPATAEGEQLTATPCCSDEHIAVEGQDEINPAVSMSVCFDQVFIASFICNFTFFFEEAIPERPEFTEYGPPLITRDLPVIYETYLI